VTVRVATSSLPEMQTSKPQSPSFPLRYAVGQLGQRQIAQIEPPRSRLARGGNSPPGFVYHCVAHSLGLHYNRRRPAYCQRAVRQPTRSSPTIDLLPW